MLLSMVVVLLINVYVPTCGTVHTQTANKRNVVARVTLLLRCTATLFEFNA